MSDQNFYPHQLQGETGKGSWELIQKILYLVCKEMFCRSDIVKIKMCNTFGVARARNKNRKKLDIVMKP